MNLIQSIEGLPFTPEVLILALRIIGFAAIPLAALLFARGMRLNSALSVAKAQKMLQIDKKTAEQEHTPIVIHKIEEPQPHEKTKKPLLVFTLQDEAQDLLRKIAVSPSREDGWNVAPSLQE